MGRGAKAINGCLNRRLAKQIEILIRRELYEQDAIIQQPEAYIQTISAIPCMF